MRVRYDEEADALYIRLRKSEYDESDEIRNKVCVPRIPEFWTLDHHPPGYDVGPWTLDFGL